MCYMKAAAPLEEKEGKNASEPFYKKAKTACDDAIDKNDANVKAYWRRAVCYEKFGEFDKALKDVKLGLDHDAENGELQKLQDRLNRLKAHQEAKAKKMYGKMFG